MSWYATPETLPEEKRCYQLAIPDNPEIIAVVIGQLSALASTGIWSYIGAVTPAQMAEAMRDMVGQMVESECIEAMTPTITEIDITPTTSFPLLLKSLVAGETIDELLITVDEVWDAGALTIGDAGDVDRLLPADYNDLTTGGQFQVSPQYKYTSAADVLIYLSGAPTTGSARITLYSYLEA